MCGDFKTELVIVQNLILDFFFKFWLSDGHSLGGILSSKKQNKQQQKLEYRVDLWKKRKLCQRYDCVNLLL